MVTFQNLSFKEEQARRFSYSNRAFNRSRASELWYMRVRYAIRFGRNGERKLEIYKRLFPECLNFIAALEGFVLEKQS